MTSEAPIYKLKSHFRPSNIVEIISAIRGIMIAMYAASFAPIFLIIDKYRMNPKTLPKIDK